MLGQLGHFGLGLADPCNRLLPRRLDRTVTGEDGKRRFEIALALLALLAAFTTSAATVSIADLSLEGKIDGELFDGGKSEGFQFMLGQGQMLKEFEEAVRGMKTGESKTFPLSFPADYHGKDVAGKQADFLVTLKKAEAAHMPEVDDALAVSLGVPNPTVGEFTRREARRHKDQKRMFD